MNRNPERIPARERHPARPNRKRVLAVQAMIAETAWLDGQLIWQDGRIVWATETTRVAPAAADLALAQRRLNQIARYPIAARRVVGDLDSWLAGRHARLDMAKQVHTIRAPDLPRLAGHAGESRVITRLTRLLAAEALCANPLPIAPSGFLRAVGERSVPALQAALDDPTLPRAARALAALVLGAIHRQAEEHRQPPDATRQDAWVERAYRWGQAHGLPPDPAVGGALLADPDGTALAGRYLRIHAEQHPFALPDQLLRDLLARGVPPITVVALAEAAATMTPVARRILDYREELPPRWREQRGGVRQALEVRHEKARQLREERQDLLAALVPLVQHFAQVTADVHAIDSIARLAHALLDLGPPAGLSLRALQAVLEGAQEMRPEWQAAYLQLLAETHEQIWAREPYQARAKDDERESWLKARQEAQVQPLRMLVQTTGDAQLAREALRFGLQDDLAAFDWRDSDLYRWVLDLARADILPGAYWVRHRFLQRLGQPGQIPRVFHPVIQSLLAQPQSLRGDLLEAILDDAPQATAAFQDELTRVPRHLPRLVRFFQATGWVTRDWGLFIRCAVVLDQALSESAAVWLDWMLAHVTDWVTARQRARQESEHEPKPALIYEENERLAVGVRLGAAVAEGDVQVFRAIVRAALEHQSLQDPTRVQEAIPEIGRFPGLRPVLAQIFPRHPRRCADLLIRVHLATRLGAEAVAPLAALAGDLAESGDPQSVPAEWQPLLELAPELAPVAAAYLHAQRLRGAALTLPAGVRSAVEQPITLARELAHLEERLAAGNARPDLATRAANLRARLAAEDKLRETIRSEVGERLRGITAEAQLAAAEHQVLTCYRTRLTRVAGPLSDGLVLDTDLLNATLLTVDITHNRRLLLRLLRAYLAGDHAWPERHPANRAFLDALADRGVDVAAWLGTHPRRYRCAPAAGGWIHLHMERDPLQILQMGNYFDTCLSFGGINAFSTVANACELNKRVIYATDGTGQIVGRKLTGLTAEDRLIGFRTYSALHGSAAWAALHTIFRRYVEDFAARCRLTLADEGTVPRLFAEAWYDDGAVPWHDENSVVARPSSHRDRAPAGG